MKKILHHPLLLIVGLLAAALFLIDTLNEDRLVSAMENRSLRQAPPFTLTSLFENDYTKAYEEYLNDQFAFRDSWITFKSLGELLFLKTESNGILYGADRYLFDKFVSVDDALFEQNLRALKTMRERHGDRLVPMFIPNSFEVLGDKLPPNIDLVPEAPYLERLNTVDGAIDNPVQIGEYLRGAGSSYLYYRNDHHWTTEASYLGYLALTDALGLTPVNFDNFRSVTVPGFLGTAYFKTKYLLASPDTFMYYDIPGIEISFDGEIHEGVYNTQFLSQADKYAGFLYGNRGVAVVHNTELHDGSEILVVKDSYANGLVPFLTQHYENIHVVDPRYYNQQLSKYIAEHDFQKIIVIYNFKTFMETATFQKITL